MSGVSLQDKYLIIFLIITKTTEYGQAEGSRHHVSSSINRERRQLTSFSKQLEPFAEAYEPVSQTKHSRFTVNAESDALLISLAAYVICTYW